jgi:phosphotransferase family enzyme
VTAVGRKRSARRRPRPVYERAPNETAKPESLNGHGPPRPAEHKPASIPLPELLSRPGTRHALLAGSRDPNAKLTLMVIDDFGPAFAVKMATTPTSAAVVRAEGELLGALHQRGLGALAATVPRPVGYATAGGLPGLVTGALPGRPMTVAYHSWHHTARRRSVRADYRVAGDWLEGLQRRTAGPRKPVTMLDEAIHAIEARFGQQTELRTAVTATADRLRAQTTPRTAVHGDYWFGNLLVDNGQVVGVVDWEAGLLHGEPLRDVARFAVSYSLYLDRHTAPESKVSGHRGLRAGPWGAGLTYAVSDPGWYGQLLREFCASALSRLGADPDVATDVLIAGIADVAATADHSEFAASHLEVLIRLLAEEK